VTPRAPETAISQPGRRSLAAPLVGTFETPLPLSAAIFQHIGRAIVEGRLRPNQRLVEMQLCQEFGCSRSPLREAIRMLAAEGLVTLTPRRGARVADLSPKTLRDVFVVRLLLEGLSARLAAEHRSDKEVAELKAMNASMRRAVESGDLNLFFALNTAFHQAIAHIGGNTYLAALQETAANRSFLPLFMFLSDARHLSAAVDAHDAILRGIEARDPAAAEQGMSQHILQIQREAEHLVESRLGSEEPSAPSERR
jgi:DNA-binding GntR family transcriptional regulator